jgi:hypothetical protein
VAKQPLDSKFTLAHIGSFLSERNPLILWESLAELSAEIQILNPFRNKINCCKSVLQTITQVGLHSYLNNMGYVSHAEAIAHQRKSQVLLLIEIDSPETKSIIPGKLFEYGVKPADNCDWSQWI